MAIRSSLSDPPVWARVVAVPLAMWAVVVAYVTQYVGASWSDTTIGWDGGWYYAISCCGYSIPDPTFEMQQTVAFFPGMPWTGRLFDVVLPEAQAWPAAGLLWGIAAAVAVALVARTVDLDPLAAVLMMAAYPAVFFTFLFYSDAMAITGSALIIVALRQQQAPIGFVGGLIAGLSRPTAIAVNGIVLVVALVKREARLTDLVASGCGMATGLGAVMIAQHQAGDAFGFLKAQDAWGREFAYPLAAFVDSLEEAGRGAFSIIHVYTTGSMVAALFMLVVIVRASQRGDWPWTFTALAAAAILLPMSTNDSSGHLRYLMHAWPAWIYVARWLPQRRMQLAVVAASLPLTLWLAGRFAVGVYLVS